VVLWCYGVPVTLRCNVGCMSKKYIKCEGKIRRRGAHVGPQGE
jgi:hypothetical protein